MENPTNPAALVALYASLAHAEQTLHQLQDNGLPYPRLQLSARVRPPRTDHTLPEHVWALTVICADDTAQLLEQLRQTQPLALGWRSDLPQERTDVEQGQNAWGHYVFESPAATDQVADAAGTSGTTGVINSGAFARQAHIEGGPHERKP